MATYAAYRHIELDKVGYSKKRVRNPPSDIFNVLCTPSNNNKLNGNTVSRRNNSHNSSFERLFGNPEFTPPRKSSLTKADVTNRNPVTGNGVVSWDCKFSHRTSPRVHNERNPVTGEYYTIISPASTPTKSASNEVLLQNGISPSPQPKANPEPLANGTMTNGQA